MPVTKVVLPPPLLLRRSDAARLLGVGPDAFEAIAAEAPDFPKPILPPQQGRAAMWPREALENFVKRRVYAETTSEK